MPAVTVSTNQHTAGSLLTWYDVHRRALPWRAAAGHRCDPYAVWLSEVMLQQTTVAAVKAYYARFLRRWPDVVALAKAPAAEVMREWAGLGYYSRARNLHACAQQVVELHGGRFPETEAALRALPGIGAYTAAAVAAIAFGRRAVVVDANVERVIARLKAIEVPLPAARPIIHEFADALTPDSRAGDFAQGLMDLGSMVCTPRRPVCALCPLAANCRAFLSGTPERFPRKLPKAVRPLIDRTIFHIVRADDRILVGTRPSKGLLGGMSELPGSAGEGALDAAPLEAGFRPVPGSVEHTFTHVTWRMHVLHADVALGTPAPAPLRWVAADALDREPFPTAMLKVLAHVRAATLPSDPDLPRLTAGPIHDRR